MSLTFVCAVDLAEFRPFGETLRRGGDYTDDESGLAFPPGEPTCPCSLRVSML
jgi:hypothetical protein